MKSSEVKVIQDPNKKPIATEILAESIVRISRGVTEIRNGRLNESGLMTLLAASTGLPKRDIKKVLDAIQDLERDYVRKA